LRSARWQTIEAFSLVELIVALGVTALISAIMITIVVNLLDTARRATGSLMSSNQAKVALDFLAQDLQSAVMRADGRVWLAATVQPDQDGKGDSEADWADWSGTVKSGNANGSLQLDPKDPGTGYSTYRLDDYRFGMAGVWLRFFTIEPDRNDAAGNLSTIRAVSYQIIRFQMQKDGSIRYGLFRSAVAPDDTFVEGYDMFRRDDGTIAAYNVPNGDEQVPGNIRKPNANFLLASNVIDFGVRFWVRNPNSGELELRFPNSAANCGFAATSDWSPGPPEDPVPPEPNPWQPTEDATMSYGFPEIAEVFLRVLTDDGAEVLEAYERNPFPGTTWWEVALAHSQVYTRRIRIKATPL